MSDSSLGCVVWSLGLRDVDDGARHTANADNTSRRVAAHEVLGSLDTEEVGAVDVDSPKLLHTFIWI